MSWKRFAGVALLLAVASGTASSQASNPSSIVFSADRAPTVTGEIYRLDPNGHQVDLSKSPYQDLFPAVSSDGKRVAFMSDRSGTSSVYEVGIEGRGLARIGPSFSLQGGGPGGYPALAWQPGGRRLALAGGNGVWILRRGHAPLRLLNTKSGIQSLAWSPDGRVLVASPLDGRAASGEPTARHVLAFSAAGHPLWKVTGGLPWPAAWSPQGLFAVTTSHGAAVYDETGRLRFEFQLPTRASFAWSPDGSKLAVDSGHALLVLSSTGRTVLRKSLTASGAVWNGNTKVVIGGSGRCGCEAKSVDIATGKLSPASERWFDTLSANRTLAIVTPKSGGGFALGVAPLGHGAEKTYEKIPGCYSHGDSIAAVTSLQFVGRTRSIVYGSWNEYCDEPFSNLYSMAPDGSGVERLTNVQAQETQPTLSPDGSEIAYVWAKFTGLSCAGCSDGIQIASAGGAAIRTLTNPQDCTFDDSPTWSPDGTTILYSETGCDGPGELFTVPAGGGTPHDLGVAGREPAWGPTRIAYVGPLDNGPGNLYAANPDGSDPTLVAHHSSHPAWSATGELAYLTGSSTLVVGSSSVKLPFKQVTSLAWSPDGAHFIVTAQEKGTAAPDVYSVKTDGTDPVRLTRNYDASGASWR